MQSKVYCTNCQMESMLVYNPPPLDERFFDVYECPNCQKVGTTQEEENAS